MNLNREYAKGMAKVKENDFLSAIEHFTAAIELDPSNVEYYAERGVAYINTNQYELSMFDMNICVDMEPNNSYRYSCRAFLKSRMGDADGAISDYEKAIMLDPEDAIAYNNLGLAQEQKGYHKKAQKSFDQSNELIGYKPNRLDNSEITANKPQAITNQQPKEIQPTKSSVAKDVFTKKSSFREFLSFIKNGFKLKS